MQTVLAYLPTVNNYYKELHLGGCSSPRSASDITCNTAVIQRKLLSKFVTSIKIVLVLKTTNTTSERSFSMLRLIKSYLRSTTGQNHLKQLMLLGTCCEKLTYLNLKNLCKVLLTKVRIVHRFLDTPCFFV